MKSFFYYLSGTLVYQIFRAAFLTFSCLIGVVLTAAYMVGFFDEKKAEGDELTLQLTWFGVAIIFNFITIYLFNFYFQLHKKRLLKREES